MDFYRTHQSDIRKDYLSGVYDVISRGDREGNAIGSRIILPISFTRGPFYMYSHYLDALVICRALGNSQFFITFTCNVNWLEIKRHMNLYHELLLGDRADVVVRVFQQKVQEFCKYLKDSRLFGTVIGRCQSFEDIRTVNSRLYSTFRAACEALGLLGDDKEWDTALMEACFSSTPSELRNLFVQLLIFCEVSDPLRTLRDILDTLDKVFGGKTVILGGDFKQTLPMKKGASKPEIIASSIAESYLWNSFKVYTLKENMWLMQSGIIDTEKESARVFASWLLDIGNGNIGEPNSEDNQSSSWV
ncbi:DNA helicase [Tanacetum coccineum]